MYWKCISWCETFNTYSYFTWPNFNCTLHVSACRRHHQAPTFKNKCDNIYNFFLSDFENLVLMMDSKPGKIYHIIWQWIFSGRYGCAWWYYFGLRYIKYYNEMFQPKNNFFLFFCFVNPILDYIPMCLCTANYFCYNSAVLLRCVIPVVLSNNNNKLMVHTYSV